MYYNNIMFIMGHIPLGTNMCVSLRDNDNHWLQSWEIAFVLFIPLRYHYNKTPHTPCLLFNYNQS